MTETARCNPDDWVEVEAVVLEPSERASGLPPETAEKPLVMWVKGFARGGAEMGEDVEIETITGRVLTGKLSAVNPGYTHTFGEPAPELVHVGRDLRLRLAEYRTAEQADAEPAGSERTEAEWARGGDV